MKLGATAYVRDSREAVEFYKEAFGLELGNCAMYPDGSYLHAELCREGKEIFDVSEETRNGVYAELALTSTQRPIMTYGINFDNGDEVRKAYRMLFEGGRVILPVSSLPWSPCCCEVIDKYGIDWFVCQMPD